MVDPVSQVTEIKRLIDFGRSGAGKKGDQNFTGPCVDVDENKRSGKFKLGYPLDSCTPYILWFGQAGSNDRGVSGGFYGDSLLDEPKKQLAAAAGSAAVEAEGELVEIIIQVFETDRPLMGAQQPALEQRDNPMDPWKRIGRRLPGISVRGRPMAITPPAQGLVSHPSVRVHNAARFDGVPYKREQTRRRGVGDTPHPDPTDTPAIFLGGDGDQGFFSVCRPRFPASVPPRYVSSTSTSPVNRSRPGRTIARRSLCSQAQAV